MTISDDLIQERFKAIDSFLEEEYVLVHIDSRASGVKLPPHLMDNPSITLKLSRLFRGGIELKPSQIETDLLFGDRYFSCEIPFVAIWGATNCDGNNVIWPESTPAEILQKIFVQSATDKKKPKEKEKEKVVAEKKVTPKPRAAKATKSPPKAGHLRRIK